ncbi:GNAT family N-acetyltransferase [Kocuria rhizophila]|uniref:GNAT family N-acetyltransferase n=1 Tax=Kocuria rhizophila TaxID=72000 RepID=UPI00073DB29E|nr:GNAT family N-acetyltransferase [Kocuria rhizophila]
MQNSSSWPLRTERLALRPYRSDDLEWVASVYSRPDVVRFLLGDPWTREEAQENVARRMARDDLEGPSGSLNLVIDRGDESIGNVSLWFTDKSLGLAEIGWVLDPDYGGQGYAREAVRAVVRLGFEHYGLHRIVAEMDARNEASARLASSVDMRREAHHLQDYWSKGEWTDSLIYALLSTDPR